MSLWHRCVIGLLVSGTLVLAACGSEGLISRLNLLGQTRFTAGDRVYGLETVQYTAADVQEVEISLVRVRPTGAIGNDDAAIVAAIEDLVLVDAEGAQSPPSAIVADPAAHEAGFVVLRFDVRGHPGPWTLKWPGNEAYTIDMR